MLKTNYNPLLEPLSKDSIEKTHIVIHQKLNFSDEKFLNIVLDYPFITYDFLKKILLQNASDFVDRLLFDTDKEMTKAILQKVMQDLQISFQSKSDYDERVENAFSVLEKWTYE